MSAIETMSDVTTLLHGVHWETYDRLVTEIENPTRLTYDKGRLEIVTPSHRHETWKTLVHAMIVILGMEVGFRYKAGGSTTLRRRGTQRGMEPDECYWIQHVDEVAGKVDLDFESDPVPDLVLEAEASRSVLDRLGILASLGVAEVWRFDGKRLVILVLDPRGSYAESPSSRCMPWLPIHGISEHLRRYLASPTDDATWTLGFRTWVRSELGR